jgi:DNA-3-methyladenine glycosylase II
MTVTSQGRARREEKHMATYTSQVDVLGPWSLATSKAFWEGFAPAALPARGRTEQIRSVFCAEADGQRAEVVVTQQDGASRLEVHGEGDLEAAAGQAARFLSLDVDARGWPAVAARDWVIADAQAQLPGLRPCGFHSPYEAAAWSVLSQRIRIVQAARMRDRLVERYGQEGAFPAPHVLRALDLDLPGHKPEYLRAVADAALDGLLDGRTLRALDPEDAVRHVQQIKGLVPFAAELVVVRGANAPDALPRHEVRLTAEIAERYGPERRLDQVAAAWRPYRAWAAVHLRVLREQRTHEIRGPAGR